jgi:pimeloyl-ACP methyl ester carboxylesterase
MISLQRRVSVNDVELAWDEWGDGPGTPLLLVHGYTGAAHDFALQVEPLAEHRRVITLDLRGHGSSTKVGRLDAYSLVQMRADVAAFVDAVVQQPVDLLGHSMGGYLMAWLTVERPDLVASLILMDTSGWAFGRPEDTAPFRAFLTAFDPATSPMPVSPPGPETALVEATTSQEWRDAKVSAELAVDPFAFKALGLELLGGQVPSVKPHLGAVTIPVTVLAGSEDHPFVDQAAELAGAFADAELVIIEGAYHSPQLTHQEQWRAVIERHLERATAVSRPA